MNKINYRSEILGLRALAILPVVFFHYGFSFFEGGFVGVDIFFVISGYLITALIIEKGNHFNIYNFYLRRIRRIVPLLLIVTLLTIPFAYYLLLPKNFYDYGKSLIFIPLFLTNFIFWIQEGYWEFSSQLKPLLHTWSLAVEAQFYILFPLIFFIKNKKNIIILFIILWLISFMIAINNNSQILLITTDKTLSMGSFYLPFSRFWEFLTGGFVFFLEKKIKFKKFFINNFISTIGLTLIVYSIFNFEYSLDYPDLYALFPVVGTGLLLIYVEKKFIIYKILDSQIFTHIGMISFSLYLWHFPIIVFKKYLTNLNSSIYIETFTLLLAYVLSIISYKYIEKPFYKNNILKNKFFLLGVILIALSISFLGLSIYKNQGKTSFIENKIHLIKKDFKSYPYFFMENKLESIDDLSYSEDESKRKILILGDSHARDLTRVLKGYNQILKSKNLKIENDFSFVEFSKIHMEKNSELFKISKQADHVFLSRQFTSEKKQFKKISKLINFFNENKIRSTLVGSAVEFYTAEDDLLLTFILQNKENLKFLENMNIEKINSYFYFNLKTYLFNTNNELKKISNKYDISFLNRFDFTCDIKNKLCFSLDDSGKKLFMDYSHFTTAGIDFFAQIVFELNWLSKVNF